MSPMIHTLATLVVVASSASAFVTSPASVQLRSLTAASTSSSTPGISSVAAPARATHISSRGGHRRAREDVLRVSAEAATTYELNEKQLRGPLVPVEDTVMVKVDLPEEVTKGGVFLPKMKHAKITRGTVIAAGEGKWHWDTGVQMPMAVKVGDRVVYGNYDGTSVEYQGSEHLLMRDTELLMAFEGEEINLDTARMIGDRVLLKVKTVPKGATTSSSSGVLIAESATRSTRPTIGEVVMVGPGRMVPSGVMMPMYCEVGDCVKYKDFAAELIKIKGLETDEYELVCIRNVDILAKW